MLQDAAYLIGQVAQAGIVLLVIVWFVRDLRHSDNRQAVLLRWGVALAVIVLGAIAIYSYLDPIGT